MLQYWIQGTSEQMLFYLEIQAVDVKGFFSEDIMVIIRSSNFITKSLSQNFFSIKLQGFLKGHKNFKNSRTCFDVKTTGDFFKFCGLLTMS